MLAQSAHRAVGTDAIVLLAVDPGTRGCGVALFDGQRLILADYVYNPSKFRGDARMSDCLAMAHAALDWVLPTRLDEIVIEHMVIYHSGRGKRGADPNDLLRLAEIGGAICVLSGAAAKSYSAKEWKGSLPKEICHRRVLDRLSIDERSRLQGPMSLLHNVLDAVGIGLHHLGRLEVRTRVVSGF